MRKAGWLGTRYLQLFVPDKLSVYREMYTCRGPALGPSPAPRIGRMLPRRIRDMHWIDAEAAFLAARGDAPLYYKTDTHLSAAGLTLAYRLLCTMCGVSPAAHVLSSTVEHHAMVMDLANKCLPLVQESSELLLFPRHAERIVANGLVLFQEAHPLHTAKTLVGSRIVLRCEACGVDPRTVVVFGDSHLFLQGGLGAMLGETFREVHLLWSSPIDWRYVERVRPDILIHQLSERFLRRMPEDGVDLASIAENRLADALSAEADRRATG